VLERPRSESQRTRKVSWRIIATNTGVAPAPASMRRPAFGPEPPLETVDVIGRCWKTEVTALVDYAGDWGDAPARSPRSLH
jgi:hypothetical protein